jgi:hypothetical protein
VFTARYGLDLDYETDLRIWKTVGKADSPVKCCRSDSSKPVTIHQNSGIKASFIRSGFRPAGREHSLEL